MCSTFVQYRGTSEYVSKYASQSGKVLGVLKRFLVEMNSDIADAEATDLEHKKTFDELSDARNEEIAASTQQHEKESFEEQETKLSNDCNTIRNIVGRIPGSLNMADGRTKHVARDDLLRHNRALGLREWQVSSESPRDVSTITNRLSMMWSRILFWKMHA